MKLHLVMLGLVACTAMACNHVDPFVGPGVQVGDGSTGAVAQVLLVGDAGAPKKDEPTLTLLRNRIEAFPGQTLVVFLGDNIYPAGLLEDARNGKIDEDARFRIDSQLAAIWDTSAKVVFVPGNHDWASGSNDGLEAIKQQAGYIAEYAKKYEIDVSMLPTGGCPGPSLVGDVGESLRVFAIDSQWHLHTGEKPGRGSECEATTAKASFRDLRRLIARSEGRRILVVGHHPVATYGKHANFYSWEDHVFPMRLWHPYLWVPVPVIGSIYPLIRRYAAPGHQDIRGDVYSEFRAGLVDAMDVDERGVVYAAGHEHSMQIITTETGHLQLVSGGGSSSKVEGSRLSDGPGTRFAHLAPGLMRLLVLPGGQWKVEVVQPSDDPLGTVTFAADVDELNELPRSTD